MFMGQDINKVKIISDVRLYESMKNCIDSADSIGFEDINQENLPMPDDNAIGLAIAESEEILRKIMQAAREGQALVVPVLLAEEGIQAKSDEQPMLILSKDRFSSEKDLYEFLSNIVKALQLADKEDMSFFIGTSRKLFFAYGESEKEDMESVVRRALNNFQDKDDVFAKSGTVLEIFNATDEDKKEWPEPSEDNVLKSEEEISDFVECLNSSVPVPDDIIEMFKSGEIKILNDEEEEDSPISFMLREAFQDDCNFIESIRLNVLKTKFVGIWFGEI